MALAEVAGPVFGGAVALIAVLVFSVGQLAARYRRECRQLRERNVQLSVENDRWREDFAAQAGELAALRRFVPGPSKVIDVSRAEVP